MPFCYFPLERLKLVDTLMQSANPKKYCVQFVKENGEGSQPFTFFNTLIIRHQQLGKLNEVSLMK